MCVSICQARRFCSALQPCHRGAEGERDRARRVHWILISVIDIRIISAIISIERNFRICLGRTHLKPSRTLEYFAMRLQRHHYSLHYFACGKTSFIKIPSVARECRSVNNIILFSFQCKYLWLADLLMNWTCCKSVHSLQPASVAVLKMRCSSFIHLELIWKLC